jgi:hypothetical protein
VSKTTAPDDDGFSEFQQELQRWAAQNYNVEPRILGLSGLSTNGLRAAAMAHRALTFGTPLKGLRAAERDNLVIFIAYLPRRYSLPDGRAGFLGMTVKGNVHAQRSGRVGRIDQFPVDEFVAIP